ncbi:TetR family transcriptional regulator [Ruegeria sp. Ofav3-42]|uniref:TetR family transcriptional regulator n=1 Tax=Ruegeria sp. Ofav3-42 TaxID=2917759 RepID=UPI001EF4FE0E|nr:TetR family transcriptional regulator [Ruegeria sp. Ofav3-42]MCG7521888.1 TetR family transcriptional regulator [Ruegeria sp. Ofav3-42]
MSRASDTEIRKAQIIDAAMDELSERGFCALKIRDVARRADVSAGLVCHHFETKHGLLLAVMRHAVTTFGKQLNRISAQDMPARDKVLALVRMALAPEQSNKRLSSVWLTLYYLAGSNEDYHAELLRYQQQNLDVTLSAVSSLFSADEAAHTSRLIVALIDGIWLQHAARAEPVDLTAAQNLAVSLTEHALSVQRVDTGRTHPNQ